MTETRGWRRLASAPDTWEAWAQRVMTICMVAVLVAAYLIFGAVSGLRDFVEDGREQRTTYQHEDTVRQCAILRGQGLSDDELRTLRC